MKIIVTFKTPDAVYYALREQYPELPKSHLVERELSKFIEDGEIIKVEFDTDAGTATVLETE